MADKEKTQAVTELDCKEVDFFIDQLAELLLRQVEEAEKVEPIIKHKQK
jgi:hypothetical protein